MDQQIPDPAQPSVTLTTTSNAENLKRVVDIKTHTFVAPQKEISTKADLICFRESTAYNEIVSFIERVSNAVIGKKIRDECHVSDFAQGIIGILETINEWIKEIAPHEVGLSRFGNTAFRDWQDKLRKNIHDLMKKSVPEPAVEEVSAYFLASFGDYQRIDYGSGHELHFLLFLFTLEKIGLVDESDYQALVLRVFQKYLKVMRALQLSYWLEPAGSQGVWGLDDYHFLPFLFGGAQLSGHSYIKPKSIHNNEIVEEFRQDYMYLECIHFVNKVKTGSLPWHSPMLNDISGVKLWAKVHSGMIKMYKAEVLGKLPIVQHILFGSLLAFKSTAPTQADDPIKHCIHTHEPQQLPTCCVPRVPSAIAATLAAQRRAIPFD